MLAGGLTRLRDNMLMRNYTSVKGGWMEKELSWWQRLPYYGVALPGKTEQGYDCGRGQIGRETNVPLTVRGAAIAVE